MPDTLSFLTRSLLLSRRQNLTNCKYFIRLTSNKSLFANKCDRNVCLVNSQDFTRIGHLYFSSSTIAIAAIAGNRMHSLPHSSRSRKTNIELSSIPSSRRVTSAFSTITDSEGPGLLHPVSRPVTVCVEGNIGCGKTTLLNYFQDFSNCEVVPEPVDKWRNVDGYNALDLMYKDPGRWGMALQTYIQLTMLQGHTKPREKDVRLLERSIYSAKYCFTDNLFESGSMPGLEHVILTKWFDWIIRTQEIQVDLFVYLQTDPELLHKRIMKRCRKEEEGIPVELLKSLHEKYEDWLIHKKHPCPAEVLVIDANYSLEEMKECYETHKSKILVSQAVR